MISAFLLLLVFIVVISIYVEIAIWWKKAKFKYFPFLNKSRQDVKEKASSVNVSTKSQKEPSVEDY